MSTPFDRIEEALYSKQQAIGGDGITMTIFDRMQVATDKRIDDNLKTKQAAIEQKMELLRSIGSNNGVFDPDEWVPDTIDGDTFIHKTEKTDEGKPLSVRLALKTPGNSYDAFETRKHNPQTGKMSDPYAQNPGRAFQHRKALALQTGKSVRDISNDDLYDYGDAQTVALRDNLESLRGQKFTLERGSDAYGRGLAVFEDPKVFDNITGGIHAGYTSSYNSQRFLEDFKENPQEMLRPEDRSIGRTLAGDAPVALAKGAVDWISFGGEFAGNLILRASIGGDQHVDDMTNFFETFNKGIEAADNYLSSGERVFDKKMDAKVDAAFSDPLFRARRQAWEKEGMPKAASWLLATAQDVGDGMEGLYEDPGRLLDMALESGVYSLGIGVIGKKIGKEAHMALRRDLLEKLSKQAPRINGKTGLVKSQEEIAELVQRTTNQAIKPAVDKIVNLSTTGIVGLTEAAQNAAVGHHQVMLMSEQELSKSAEYMKLRERGATHEAARLKMSRKAFDTIFVTNFALASAASHFTGAANFEGNMLRQLRSGQKVGMLRSVGRNVQRAGVAGGREFLEESIQSGGGELISQIATQDATGKTIGPGVGKALAEGGLTGLAMGVGMSEISDINTGIGKGVLKVDQAIKLAGATKYGKERDAVIRDANGKLGGDQTDAMAKANLNRNKDGVYEGAEADLDTMFQAAKDSAAAGEPAPRLANAMNVMYGEYLKAYYAKEAEATQRGEVQSEEQKKQHTERQRQYGQYMAEYKVKLNQAATKLRDVIYKADPDSIKKPENKKDYETIVEAARYGFKFETKDEDLGRYLSSVRDTELAVKEADLIAQANRGLGEYQKGTGIRKDADTVYEEKMGFSGWVVNGIQKLGLKGHKQAVQDSIQKSLAQGTPNAYEAADAQLGSFLISAKKGYEALAELYIRVHPISGGPEAKQLTIDIEKEVNKKYGTNIFYVPSNKDGSLAGTALLLKKKSEELIAIGAVRQSLAAEAAAAGIRSAVTADAQENPIPGFSFENVVMPVADSSIKLFSDLEEAEAARTIVPTEASAEVKVEGEVAEKSAPPDFSAADAEPNEALLGKINPELEVPKAPEASGLILPSNARQPAPQTASPAVQIATEELQVAQQDYDLLRDSLKDDFNLTDEEIDQHLVDQQPGAFPRNVRDTLDAIVQAKSVLDEAQSVYTNVTAERTQEEVDELNQQADDYADALAMNRDDRILHAFKLGMTISGKRGAAGKVTLSKAIVKRKAELRAKRVKAPTPTPVVETPVETEVEASLDLTTLHKESPFIGSKILIPLIHATKAALNTFIIRSERAKDQDTFWLGAKSDTKVGFYLTANTAYGVAVAGGNDNPVSVLSFWVNMQRPYIPVEGDGINIVGLSIAQRDKLISEGYDGVADSDFEEVVVFNADQLALKEVQENVRSAPRVTKIVSEPVQDLETAGTIETFPEEDTGFTPPDFTGLPVPSFDEDTGFSVPDFSAEGFSAPTDGEGFSAPDFTQLTEEAPDFSAEEAEKVVPTEPEVLDDVRLEGYRRTVRELRRLIQGVQAGEIIDPTEIRFTNKTIKSMFTNYMRETDGNIIESAQKTLDYLVAPTGFNFGEQILEEPTSEANPEDEAFLLAATEDLVDPEEGELGKNSIFNQLLSTAVDFLSDKTAKYLGAWVGYRRYPDEEWTEDKLAAVKTNIARRFAAMKLPTQILQAFSPKRNMTTNLLGMVPRVFGMLQKGRTKMRFYKAAGASIKEEQGMNGVISFVTQFVNTMKATHLGMLNDILNENTTFKREKLGDKGVAVANPLREYLFQFLLDFETGSLNENVASIMALVAGEWIASRGGSTINNKNYVINKLLGRNKDTFVSGKEREVFGNGTIATKLAQQLGAKVLRDGNFSLSGMEGLDPTFQNRFEASIGLMIMASLQQMQRAEYVAVSAAYRNSLADKDENYVPENQEILLFFSKVKDSQAELKDEDHWTEIPENEELRTDFNTARRLLKNFFGISAFDRRPMLTVPKAPTKVERSLSKVPDKHQSNIAVTTAKTWEPVETVRTDFERFSVEGFKKQVLGKRDDSELKLVVHEDAMASEVSKNRRIDASVAHAREWLRRQDNKLFYFAYSMISSFRIMITSNTINPSGDKFHRFMFGMTDWKATISSNLDPAPNDDGTTSQAQLDLVSFKMSVALALGIKTDVNYIKDIMIALDGKLADPTIRAALEIMKTNPDKYTPEQEAAIGAAITVAHDGEREHAYAGLRAWADFENGKGEPVTITLPMELDGKTNGYASLLLQFVPPTEAGILEAQEFYEAVGVFFNNSIPKNYPQFIQQGGQDNYNSVTSASKVVATGMRNIGLGVEGGFIPRLHDEILVGTKENKDLRMAYAKEDTDEGWDDFNKLTEEMNKYVSDFQQSIGVNIVMDAAFIELNRDFAKNPLTVVAYSAGMRAVRRAVVAKALEKLQTEIAAAGSTIVKGDMSEAEYYNAVAAEIGMVLGRAKAVVFAAAMSRDAAGNLIPIDVADMIEKLTAWVVRTNPDVESLIKFRRNYRLDDTQKELFELGIDMVFGHSLQVALEEKLKVIRPMTEDLNYALYFVNLVFTKDFARRMAATKELVGHELVNAERYAILNQMIKEGLVPTVKTPLSESQLDSLEITSMGQVTLREARPARAYYKKELDLRSAEYDAEGNKVKPEDQVSSVSQITAVDADMNIGVGAIALLTHSSDSAVASAMMGQPNGILNLWDAKFENALTSAKTGLLQNQEFYNVHRQWNMAQEIADTFHRFWLLTLPENSRLSADDKADIYKDFNKQRMIFESKEVRSTLRKANAQSNFIDWRQGFERKVAANNKGREILFGGMISHVNQFAQEDTSWPVPRTGNVESAVAAAKQELISKTWNGAVLAAIIRDDESNARQKEKTAVIAAIKKAMNSRNGDTPQSIFVAWLQRSRVEAPLAEDVLDVIYAVLNSRQGLTDEQNDTLRNIVNIIRPALNLPDAKGNQREVLVRVDPRIDLEGDDGRYYPDGGTIIIRGDANNIFQVVLHEILHAANVKMLESLPADHPRFVLMRGQAIKWARENIESGGKSEKKAANSILAKIELKAPELFNEKQAAEFNHNKEAFAISEYVAHLNSEISWTQGQISFHFYTENTTTNAFKALADTMQDTDGNYTFYSSGVEPDAALFGAVENELLVRANFEETLQRLKDDDAAKGRTPDDTTQAYFDTLALQIAEGLDSIESLLFKIAESPTAVRNIGGLAQEGGEASAHIQTTAQNYITSPLDMSAQEVFLHEVKHAFIEHALGFTTTDPITGKPIIVGGNPNIQTEARRLFEVTEKWLHDTYGQEEAWRAFLPPGAGTALDEDLAKARYKHIMESDNHQEFVAATDPQLAALLKTIPNRPDEPYWRGNIFDSLIALFARIINAIKGEIFVTHPKTISDGLQALTARIIKSNQKQKERSKKPLDSGYVSAKVQALNDAAVEKLAGVVLDKLRAWAERNTQTGQALDESLERLGMTARALVAIKAATASGVLATKNIEAFRDAYMEVVTKQDHWAPEMLQEILPWADRNRNWIDQLRRSEVLIDGRRQQIIEHTRSGYKKLFLDYEKYSPVQREAISKVMLMTDLAALFENDANSSDDILKMIVDNDFAKQKSEALEARLAELVNVLYAEKFNKQSKGLANLMVKGIVTEYGQMHNIHNIVERFDLNPGAAFRPPLANEEEIKNVLEQLTSIRALQLVEPTTRLIAGQLLTKEANRNVEDNGFNGTLAMALVFKRQALRDLFQSNPILMWKGYMHEILDEEMQVEVVPLMIGVPLSQLQAEMKSKGWNFIEVLPRDPADPNKTTLVSFYTKRGIATYSKANMSLTNEGAKGMDMFESAFISNPNQRLNATAAQVHSWFVDMKTSTHYNAQQQFYPAATPKGAKMLPKMDDKGNIVGFRYVMSEDHKIKYLKKRSYADEVLPGMMASIHDKVNTKRINREIVTEALTDYNLYQDNLGKKGRFVAIGKYVDSKESRQMWELLPKDTQQAVRDTWGDQLFYVRDDAVNLVMGFRKMSVANLQMWGKAAPMVRAIEKVWQELIQWERFRIAVLNPTVVLGNIVSNFILLKNQNIPLSYILRETLVAITGMRKYQKDVRERNELTTLIQSRQVLGQSTRVLEARLARLESAILYNPVHELVQEGLFTSIVEEFGNDENSTRRKFTTKVLEHVGGITGSRGAVNGFQELFMVPGSRTGQAALLATQYGDFMGRFVKYNWDTNVKKVSRRQAIHESLDTFIYYNLPQNRVLQALNDNGLMMFTKFFFRIQPIIARTFARNPVSGAALLTVQGLVANKITDENIANYAFMNNVTDKFELTPWDHVMGGDLFWPSLFKWFDWFD